jgi:uncharacterized membrane protein YbhN (UPF0104 family)
MYRKISAIVVPTLIAIGILGYMLYSVWGQLLVALQNMIPAYLLVAIPICLVAWWLRGWRYRTILRSLNYDVNMTDSTACIFVSQTVNLVVPARLGDFTRVFILKHEYNTTYSEGVSSLVVERVFDIITVALLGAIAFFFVLNLPSEYTLLIIVPLVAGILFFAFLPFIGKFSSENKYLVIVMNMLHVCLSIVLMFEQTIPFAVVVLAIVIGNLVKAVPITPGGIGTYEATIRVIFVTLAGVDPAVASLIAITDHLIKNLVTLAGGVASNYYFGDWVIPSIRDAFDSKFGGGKQPDS